MEVGRNAPCPCGSGKKYKRCCALKAGKSSLGGRIAIGVIALMLLTAAGVMLASMGKLAPPTANTAPLDEP